jgi:hypothetical protein
VPRKSSSALAFSTSTADRIKPPGDLAGEARKLFVDLVCSCRPDHFDPVDAPVLARYARALVEEKVAADELALAYILDSRPSPWLAIWQAKIRAVTTLSRMLKLNPAGRHSAPSSAEPPLPLSYFERQALERQRNGEH